MQAFLQSEYYGGTEQIFWEAAQCYCPNCGSDRKAIQRDGEILGIRNPICCEVNL